MLYFIMLVSNNNLLNILLPNENKVLKEVLKEADNKTLNNIKNNNTNIGDILRNLFSDIQTGTKSKSSIENILKNSNIFKELGVFSNNLSSLLKDIDNNSNLSKYKPILQSFLKDISQLDDKALKDLFIKSGIFLESKILEQGSKNSNLPKNLETLLLQIKTLLKDIPNVEAKNISNLIDKLLSNSNSTQSNGDFKSLVSMLQNLSKNLGDKNISNLNILINELKNVSSNAQLIESKLANNVEVNDNLKNSTLQETKNILLQLRNQISQTTIANKTELLNQVEKLLTSSNIFSKDDTSIEPKQLLNQLVNNNELNSIAKENKNINQLISNLKNLITNNEKIEIPFLKDNLMILKNELLNIKSFDTNILNQIIDKLLNIQNLSTKIEIPTSFKSNDFFSNINNLILNLKENLNNSSISNQLQTQQNILKIIDKLENILSNQNQQSSIQNDIKSTLLQIQDQLTDKIDPKTQELSKNIEKMLTQIDYYQLLSISSNSNSVYIPFIWDMLEDGSISMKKIDEEKFYCEINLTLKEFGETQLMLALYDKNKLDLTIYASKDSFKQSIRENSTKLKQALNSVDLIPVNIKIIDMKKEETKDNNTINNPYAQNSDLGFGINIKV